MKTKKNIYDLHEENKSWLSSVNFYKDELIVMQKRIEEIAEKNSAKEVRVSIEHFQNQLIVQNEQLDILAHDIRDTESAVEKTIDKNPTAIDHRHFPDQTVLAGRIKTHEKIFRDLRSELAHFLSKRM